MADTTRTAQQILKDHDDATRMLNEASAADEPNQRVIETLAHMVIEYRAEYATVTGENLPGV